MLAGVRNLVAAFLVLFACLAGNAFADKLGGSMPSQDQVVAALETRYQATLIRERKLADDRELVLLARAEDSLRQARLDFDRKLSGAEAALRSARAEYAELVSSITRREAIYAAEIAAWREEAQSLAASAPPELQQAYLRFTDGDQEAAYEIIAELTQAQVKARLSAASKVASSQVRQQADFRNLMRIDGTGGATALEVLALLDQAIALDDSNYLAHFERAVILAEMGAIEEALKAVELSEKATSSLYEEFYLKILKGDLYWQNEEWEAAQAEFIDAFFFLDEHPNILSDHVIVLTLDRIGASAFPDYSYDLMLLHSLMDAAATNPGYEAAIGRAKSNLPPPHKLEPFFAEMAGEALTTALQIEIERSDGSRSSQRSISVALGRLAKFYAVQSKFAEANSLLLQAYDLDQKLMSDQPTRQAVQDLLTTIEALGDIAVAEGNFTRAWSLMDEAAGLEDMLRRDGNPDQWLLQADISKLARRGARAFIEDRPDEALVLWTEALLLVQTNSADFGGLESEAQAFLFLTSLASDITRR